jgi:hypothetical protein
LCFCIIPDPAFTPRLIVCCSHITPLRRDTNQPAGIMDGDQSYEYAVGGHEDDVSDDSQAT